MTVNAVSHIETVDDADYGQLVVIHATEDLSFSPEAARAFAVRIIEEAARTEGVTLATRKAKDILSRARPLVRELEALDVATNDHARARKQAVE